MGLSKGRTGHCLGPRKGTATRRNVIQGHWVTLSLGPSPRDAESSDRFILVGGGGGALRGSRRRNNDYELPCPSGGKFWRRSCQILSEGPKVVQNLETEFTFRKRHKTHQIDQRNVLNVKMYAVGAKNQLFNGQNWPKLAGRISSSSFRHRRGGYIHFCLLLPELRKSVLDLKRRVPVGSGAERTTHHCCP